MVLLTCDFTGVTVPESAVVSRTYATYHHARLSNMSYSLSSSVLSDRPPAFRSESRQRRTQKPRGTRTEGYKCVHTSMSLIEP